MRMRIGYIWHWPSTIMYVGPSARASNPPLTRPRTVVHLVWRDLLFALACQSSDIHKFSLTFFAHDGVVSNAPCVLYEREYSSVCFGCKKEQVPDITNIERLYLTGDCGHYEHLQQVPRTSPHLDEMEKVGKVGMICVHPSDRTVAYSTN